MSSNSRDGGAVVDVKSEPEPAAAASEEKDPANPSDDAAHQEGDPSAPSLPSVGAEDAAAAVASAVEAAVAEAAQLAAAAAADGEEDEAAQPQHPHPQQQTPDDADRGVEDDDDLEMVKASIEVDAADQPRHAAHNTRRSSDVAERDVVLNHRDDNPKMHLFLEDLVHLHHVLWQLQGKTDVAEEDLQRAARRAVQLLKGGKAYELGGLRDVPRPFLKSPGRILERDSENTLQELSDDDAVAKIQALLADKVQKEPLGERLKESPYREFQRRLERNVEQQQREGDAAAPTTVQVEPSDAVLSRCGGAESGDEGKESSGTESAAAAADAKVVFNLGPQQVLFNLAAQIVTTYTINAETQVKAAVAVLNGLDETEFAPVAQPPSRAAARTGSAAAEQTVAAPPLAAKHSRFVLRTSAAPPTGSGSAADGGGEEPPAAAATWSLVSDADALEWAVTFVFEVHLEKDLDYMTAMLPTDHKQSSSEDQSKFPVKEPTNYDVLFGRGGMTNSHVGNRRFRDIIALHRPDYIRAIKMDKPAVARKIVKAIRFGHPPGRFLKKSEDGNWYDVGDRTAAEKTSQGLRERTNAEKRQRSQLRRALRLRKEDLEDDEDAAENNNAAPNKKARVGDVGGSGGGSDAANLAATLAPTLNYVGTNLGVPLSLNMAQVVQAPVGKKKAEAKNKTNSLGLNTEGLPPNAVDEDGNILVTDYDILLGRGGLTNHHKGNKRFRDIVALHRSDYVRAPKIQKPSVARVIVRAIRNGDPPGRFLRKDEKTGKWIDVGDKKAAEKTSQALREKATEEREKLKSEPGSVGILVPTPASYLAATTANVIGNILASGTFTGTAGETVVATKEAKEEQPPGDTPQAKEADAKETDSAVKEVPAAEVEPKQEVLESVAV